MLPSHASVHNPIDLAGAGERALSVYGDLTEVLLADDAFDAVALTGYFGSYGSDIPSLQHQESAVAQRIAQAARTYDKPVVVHSMSPTSATLDLLGDLGVPTYDDVDAAAVSLGAAVRLSAESGRVVERITTQTQMTLDGYVAARELLAGAGIAFQPARRVSTRDELAQAASELAAPYVLKADWIAHKTDVGAVAVGLDDVDAAADAFDDMVARLGPGAYVLEEMDVRADCVEMIVGARRDSAFGATVMVEAELIDDTVVELAPVDRGTAAAMVRSLKSHRLLEGWRSRPAVDIDGLVRSVVALSRLIAARPDCVELEINPLRVGPDGVRALDALVNTDEGV